MALLSFLNSQPPLAPGDEVRWQRPAAYCLDNSTVGGTLSVTLTQLVFMPNRMSSRRDWGPQRIGFADVSEITVMKPTGTPYNGGLRHRVQIDTHHHERHLLIIEHPDEVAAQLRKLVASRGR
jgi:hypothetical protein